MARAAVHAYGRLLKTHPYQTNACNSAVLMLLGDRAAQSFEARDAAASGEPPPPARVSSWQRTSILVVWASCIGSPFWVRYYQEMHRRYSNKVLRAVVLTQIVSVPFNTVFFSAVTALEHLVRPEPWARAAELPTDIAEKLATRLPSTLIASASVWPFVNWANFTFTPPHLRNVVAASVALLWNVFLSLQNSGRARVADHTHHQAHGAGPASAAAAAAAVAGPERP